MGASQSNSNSKAGAEMASTEDFSAKNLKEPVSTLQELSEELQTLNDGCKKLRNAIDELFEGKDEDETSADLEQRLQGITRANQVIVKKLVHNLELHAKRVHNGPNENELFMSLVKKLVCAINDYMTMLICNIRKLKRLIAEIHESAANNERFRSGSGAIRYNQIRPRRDTELIYDVISEHLDVDAMLLQLVQTEKQREDLEKDMVTVLVFWRDYRYVITGKAERKDSDLDDDIREAADSIAAGLAQLSCMTPSSNEAAGN